jgi:hypothetical protein
MTGPAVSVSLTIPAEVERFAAEHGLSAYVAPMIDLARQAFPSSAVQVSLDRDVEDEKHQYVAIDVDVADKDTQELLAGQRTWSAGVARICPSRHAVYFVLGWR